MTSMNSKHELVKFPDGLTLLLAPMEGVKSATVLVMVRTGSRDEPEELMGISHFLEHMVFKGTEKYPTPLDLTSTIDSFGGEMNAFTSKEFTGFYIKAAVEHLDIAVDVLAQMLTKPLLAEDAIEREKGVIVEEINMYEDLPTRKVSVLFDQLIYGKNGLGRETIGSKKSVMGMSRENFKSYLNRRYTKQRVVVGVVGGLGNSQKGFSGVRKLVSEGFTELSEGESNGWQAIKVEEQKKPRVKLFEKETDQAHFVLGVPSYARGHKDRFVLSVLSALLGGNMSSRLFTEVREKRGLAYYIKSDLDVYYDAGSFTVHAGVEKQSLSEAIKVIIDQFNEISNSKIVNDEVARAKENLKGRLILELEDSYEVADLYVRRFVLERKVMTPEQLIRIIDKVSLEDVVRVAKDLFKTGKLNLSVIGPYKKEDGRKLDELLNS